MARAAENRKREVVTRFRRGEILEAAAHVFGLKGFEDTRMDDIAARADLAKATVYVYFRSKEEIYEAVVEQTLLEISALTEEKVGAAADLAGKLSAFITVRFGYWRKKPSLYTLISTRNRELRVRRRGIRWERRAVDFLAAMFAAASRRGEIPEQDFEAAAWAVVDMIRGIHERRILYGETTLEEEAGRLSGFVLRALGYGKACRPAAREQRAAGG